MKGTTRSSRGIVPCEIDVKDWLASTPSVESSRPGRCPWCGTASRPAGLPLAIHGHGTRDRRLHGPIGADTEPEVVRLRARRFFCCACEQTITVLPRGVQHRRLFSSAAIGLAIALWALLRLASPEVRRRVSPQREVGATSAAGWPMLRRWVDAIRAGSLFAVRACPPEWTRRQCAERAATTLQSHAPASLREQSKAAQVFAGAALAP
jgi:hypothetical protein